MILLSSTLTFRRCGGGWCHLLWFLLFSMCYSLHVAVNVCINCSFLHLFHVNGDSQLSVHDFPLVICANRVSSALYRFHDLALYWLQARDCNPCPSLHTCLSPAPLVRRSHVHCTTRPDTPDRLAYSDSRPRQQSTGQTTHGQRQGENVTDLPILNNRLLVV